MMALFSRLIGGNAGPGPPKALQRFQNCIAFLWPSLLTQNSRSSTQVDVMETFANDLVARKTKKWEHMCDMLMSTSEIRDDVEAHTTRRVTQSLREDVGLLAKGFVSDLTSVRAPELGLDVRTLSQAQLDNLLLSTLEIKNKLDFLYLINESTMWKLLPSNSVLIACLKYLSSLSKLQQIETLAEVCREKNNPILQTYAGLAAFKAMAQWRNGNANAALSTLREGYAQSMKTEEGYRIIRAAFRTIVEETLTKKSEAVLVALLEEAANIHKEFNDITILAFAWKQCFMSDWFSDQKSATMLFEKYDDLQHLVRRRSLTLCATFLRQHNVDAVHRLIEVFLQYKQRDACWNCLRLLFDFQYYRQNLRACAEIVKSCNELEMPLSETQNAQFLNLFLHRPVTMPISNQRAVTATQQFHYKF